MKALLIYPTPPQRTWPRGLFRSRWVPTGLACLAAALRRAGHDVRVEVREERLMRNRLNWVVADAALRDLLAEFRPDLVGFSMVSAAVGETARLAELVRAACGSGPLLVGGGPHPTAVPELTFRDCPQLDALVLGEGEETVVELADRGVRADVAGLAFRGGDGRVVRTAARPPPADLDALGPPAGDLFDPAFYGAADRWMVRWLKLRAANVRTSRGCTNRCLFCGGHLVSQVGVRAHSVGYVIERMREAVERLGVEAIHFEDDTLGADRGRLGELCEAIRRADLHRRVVWDGCLRADQADAELLAEMKAAGCIQVEYGFESGSDESLRRLGKGASGAVNLRAARLTRAAGLRIFADIMVGLVGETEADWRATERFLRRVRPEVIAAGLLCPLPGTPLFDQLDLGGRDAIDWGQFAYLDAIRLGVNLTAMDDAKLARRFGRFNKYIVQPQVLRALLRDSRGDETDFRRELKRQLRRFVLHHPLRALRVPW